MRGVSALRRGPELCGATGGLSLDAGPGRLCCRGCSASAHGQWQACCWLSLTSLGGWGLLLGTEARGGRAQCKPGGHRATFS